MTEQMIIAQREATCALTDLALAIMMIPMTVILACRKTGKKKTKKWWVGLFITLDVSAIMGFILHYYCPQAVADILWHPLYAIMAEIFVCFFLLARCLRWEEQKPARREVVILHLIALAVCLLTGVIVLTTEIDFIRVLTVYALALALPGFWFILQGARRPGHIAERLIVSALIPLLIGAYFQLERRTVFRLIWWFDYNSITHVMFLVGVAVIFAGALYSLRPARETPAE